MEPAHLPNPDNLIDAAVWSMADVASYLRLDRRQVRRLLGVDATFPRPVWISPRVCRFDAASVRGWVRDGGSPTPQLAANSGRRIVERV
jgi:predicted DNA-binding transcriptional regulator AlpA